MIIWVVIAAVVFIVAYLAIEQVRHFVIRQQILDIPNDRSSHVTPTPRGGGIVISFGTIFGLLVYMLAFDITHIVPIGSFLIAGLLITTISWIDDVRNLSAKIRFGTQFIAALLIITGIGYWESINVPYLFNIDLGLVAGVLITTVWLVGLTNAYNFMDGIDGLASGQAVIAGLSWAYVGWQINDQTIFIWSLLIAATALGFLLHNWHPAKIFMGDVGSAFLGLTFATLPLFVQAKLVETDQQILFSPFFLAIVFVWLFLFDTVSTFIKRLFKRENVFAAHRTHLYQLLNRSGSPHHHVTFLYLVLAIIPIPVTLGTAGFGPTQTIFVFVLIITFSLGLLLFTRKIAPHIDKHSPNKGVPLNIGFMFNTLNQLAGVRNRHLFIADLIFIIIATFLSYVLRFETVNQEPVHLYSLFIFLAFSLTTIPLVFHFTGLYTRYWRYASLSDLIAVCTSLLLANILASIFTITVIWVGKLSTVIFPRSIPFIFYLLILGSMLLARLNIRFLHWRFRQAKRPNNVVAVAIMGAGDSGELLLREAQRDTKVRWEVRAFLDDDPNKHGMLIHGVPVIGGREKMASLKSHLGVQRIIIAMPSAEGHVIRSLIRSADTAGLESKITPTLQELLYDSGLVKQIRDVAIEDLLRRKSIDTNTTAVQELVQGKRVLITGGGGSIGSELCRQVLRCKPAELILIGHGENSIFGSHNELKTIAGDTKLTAIIADIRFPERVRWIFETHRPEIVFHAAAHKHVPLMEMNPVEAITNNVFGTRNLLEAAQLVDVDHFVMISTDKAVNPTNIMGASKRTAELLVHQAAIKSGKTYVAVRFGNVLGSRGSVVLTFKQQIARGGPVTVTHPDMTRFFMTIPEAVQLVLQAAVLGNGGDVFVLDMGEPVKIVDLAKDLIRLSGLELGRDIDIEFVGMRPGEKLYEELFISGENYQRTQHEKIFLASNAGDLVPLEIEEWADDLIDHAHLHQIDRLFDTLHKLVPEFLPDTHNKQQIKRLG